MKKIVAVTLLCLVVILAGCENRISKEAESIQSQQEEVSKVEEDSSKTESLGEESRLDESEQESIAIATAIKLLERAKVCEDIYTGSLAQNSIVPPQELGEDKFYFLDSQFYSPNDIEKFWAQTFVADGKSTTLYNEIMGGDPIYRSINGELYMKESDRPATMTDGQWDTQNIKAVKVEEEIIVVAMNTTLAGQPNGEKELTLEKYDSIWLLNNSYFLD